VRVSGSALKLTNIMTDTKDTSGVLDRSEIEKIVADIVNEVFDELDNLKEDK